MSINLVGGGSWNGKAKIAPNAHPLGTLNDVGEVVGVVVKWNGLGGTLKRGRNPYHQLDRIARSCGKKIDGCAFSGLEFARN